MKNNLKEYDVRQLKLMDQFVSEYKLGTIPLGILIDNLRGLLECLESVDTKWIEKFHEQWFELEQIYAVALYRKEDLNSYDKEIDDLLEGLGFLIDYQLKP